MRHFTMLALFIFCLSLAGGCVRTISPVLTDDQLVTNDDILGKWTPEKGDTSYEVQADKGKTYKGFFCDKGSKTPFLARLGKIGDLTVVEFSGEQVSSSLNDVFSMRLYSFMIVEQTKPQLVLSAMSQEWLMKYLDAHPQELQYFKTQGEYKVVVTSSTADLQAFLVRHAKDEGAFEKLKLYRPDDPASRPAP